MPQGKPRLARRKVGCLQRMLRCCMTIPDDEVEDEADASDADLDLGPGVGGNADAIPSNHTDYLAVLRKQDEARFAAERKAKAAEKPTGSEIALRGDPRLERASITLDVKAEQAWTETLGAVPELAPATVVARLLDQLRKDIRLGENLLVQVLAVPGGVSLTLNCRKDPDKAKAQGIPENMVWDRRACEMSVTRTITRGPAGVAVHDDRTDMRGGGCKQLYHALLPLYRALGVKTVSMDAKDVGSYAWVGYGFRPDAKTWLVLRDKVGATLDRLIEAGTVDGSAAKPVRALLRSDDPETIEAVARLDRPVVRQRVEDFDTWNAFKDADLRLGQVLLAGQGWHGSLDLANPAVVEALERQVGLRG